jgi:hypothetical protein
MLEIAQSFSGRPAAGAAGRVARRRQTGTQSEVLEVIREIILVFHIAGNGRIGPLANQFNHGRLAVAS